MEIKEILEELVSLNRRGYRICQEDQYGYKIDPYCIVSSKIESLRIRLDGDDFSLFSLGGLLTDEECHEIQRHIIVTRYKAVNKVGMRTYYNDSLGIVDEDSNSLLWGGEDRSHDLSEITKTRLDKISRMLPQGMRVELSTHSPWGAWTESLRFYRGEELEEICWKDEISSSWETGHPSRESVYSYETPESFVREEILNGVDPLAQARLEKLKNVLPADVSVELSAEMPASISYDAFRACKGHELVVVIWEDENGHWCLLKEYPYSNMKTFKCFEEALESI